MSRFPHSLGVFALLGAPVASLAQTGSLTYVPESASVAAAAAAGSVVQPVPIPAFFLFPLGLLMVFLGSRFIKKHGANHALGALLFLGGVLSTVSMGLQVREATAIAALLELDNPAGDTIVIPEGVQEFNNSSGVSLKIASLTLACVASEPANECVTGDVLEANASCTTAFICPSRTLTIAHTNDAAEPATQGTFTITSSAAAPRGGLTVYYTIGGTASPDADYTALSGSVLLPEGATQVNVSVETIDDADMEDEETVELTLTADATYLLGGDTASVALVSDDSDGLFLVSTFQVLAGGTDTQLNNTAETIGIWTAIDGGATLPGSVSANGNNYTLSTLETGTSTVADYGGSGDFGSNLAYTSIGGGAVSGGNDFSVRAQAKIRFKTAGTYSIAAGSDDGRRISLVEASSGSAPGYTGFTAQGDQVDAPFTSGQEFVIFNNPTGHNQSVGVFTVAAGDVLSLESLFYERGGGDSFEISIASGDLSAGFNNTDFELLQSGVLSGEILLDSGI